MQHRTPFLFPNLLSVDEQRNPHKVLEEFLLYMDLPYARKIIHQWLSAACNKGWFNKECPANLLFFYEHVCKLAEAGWCISQLNNSAGPGNLPLPLNPTQLPDSCLYCPAEATHKGWDYFPRHLSPRDFYQPYRVFTAFFQYQSLNQWRNVLYRLLHQALSVDSFDTAALSYNLLTIKKHLCKLVEASQLIVLRRQQTPGGSAPVVAITPEVNSQAVTLTA